ncbi:hypothetical protein DA100_10550 [Vibrio sp. Hep-1b-8]|nr:hypothetical protein DA100_10550 [Vibrio sp. Hep-1b-8]
MTARNDHSIRNVGSIALTHTFCQWTAGERLQLSLRCYNAQVGEIMANVKAIKKVLGLGMPVRS